MTRSTQWLRATLVLPLLPFVTLGGCGGEEAAEPPPPRPVRTVIVGSGSGPGRQSLAGVVEASERTRLSFQVSGRLQTLSVQVGDDVEEGQAIATLDPTDFELQLSEARASAAQASAQARSAAGTYTRIRALYSSQNASQQELDNARAQRDSAQSAASAASQTVRRLERQLAYASISAPAFGSIAEVPVEPNEVVNAGQVIAVLQSGDSLQVAVDVPESAIARVTRGDTVEVRFDALEGAVAEGTVAEVGVPGGPGAAFPVKVRLPGDVPVRSGMAATVSFERQASSDANEELQVPVTAVGEDREGRFVFVLNPGDGETGTVERRSVEIGSIGTDGIAIRSGIEPGEVVVIAGVSRISDGLEVRITPPENRAGAAETADEGTDDEVTDGEGPQPTPEPGAEGTGESGDEDQEPAP